MCYKKLKIRELYILCDTSEAHVSVLCMSGWLIACRCQVGRSYCTLWSQCSAPGRGQKTHRAYYSIGEQTVCKVTGVNTGHTFSIFTHYYFYAWTLSMECFYGALCMLICCNREHCYMEKRLSLTQQLVSNCPLCSRCTII